MLSNLSLTDLAATSPEQYVHKAVQLARDLPRLQSLRATLRQRMEQSPLMDAPRFARNIEAAYRQMSREHCSTPATSFSTLPDRVPRGTAHPTDFSSEPAHKKTPANAGVCSTPKGSRTPVFWLRTRCPGPLDDRGDANDRGVAQNPQ